MSQQFKSDEIHYTESAGKVFVDSILTTPIKTQSFKTAIASNEPNQEQPSIEALRGKVKALENELGKPGSKVDRNRKEDSLMFARIRE